MEAGEEIYLLFSADAKEDDEVGFEPETPSKEETIGEFKCEVCDKDFVTKFLLEQHGRTHTGEKPFFCVFCGKAFTQKANVKRHIETHKVWPNPSQDSNSLETEVTTEKGKNMKMKILSSFDCQYCDSNFRKLRDFQNHMKSHRDKMRFRCTAPNCLDLFETVKSYSLHKKTNHPDSMYSCPIDGCDKQVKSLEELKIHKEAHRLKDGVVEKSSAHRLTCTLCNVSFPSPEAFHHHNETTEHTFQCNVCKKLLQTERSLHNHIKTFHTDEQTTFTCDICLKQFKSQFYLKSHLLIHTGETPFQCGECGKAFNRKDKLKRHETCHGEKSLKCPTSGCSRAFSRMDKLKEHVLSHGGSAPLRCPACPEVFTKVSDLAMHKNKVHGKPPKELKCFKCNKRFKLEVQRQRHHELVHGIVHNDEDITNVVIYVEADEVQE